MKKIILISFSFFLFSFSEFKKQKQVYEDNEMICLYETVQGRLEGKYISFYKNGKKKAEGTFESNYRIGKWTIWDSTGRIKVQRNYSDPFTFKQIIPKIYKEAPIKLLNVSPYKIKYSNDGFIADFYLRERAVVWAKAVYRKITPNENPLLFENQILFNLISKNIQSNTLTAYKSNDEPFKVELKTQIDPSNYQIIAFKIADDFCFDNERLVSEFRIIGLCPIAIDIKKKDTVDLYWVYFKPLRKDLASAKIHAENLPEKIKTLDDLFFFRYYSSSINKEINYNKTLAIKTDKEIEKESQRMEVSLIEKEHEIWASFAE